MGGCWLLMVAVEEIRNDQLWETFWRYSTANQTFWWKLYIMHERGVDYNSTVEKDENTISWPGKDWKGLGFEGRKRSGFNFGHGKVKRWGYRRGLGSQGKDHEGRWSRALHTGAECSQLTAPQRQTKVPRTRPSSAGVAKATRLAGEH